MLTRCRHFSRVQTSIRSCQYHSRNQQLPLPFLYPRWFASAAAAPQTSKVQNDVTTHTVENATSSQSHAQNEAEKDDPQGPIWRAVDWPKPMNTRPTKRLVRKALGREKGKDDNRKEALRMRLNYTDALDWKAVLKTLEENTPVETFYSWKQTRHIHFEMAVDELYDGDLRQFFLGLLLLTECHVQVLPTSKNVLVLTGDTRAIKRAVSRLRKAFSNPQLKAQVVEVGEIIEEANEDITLLDPEGPSPRAVFSNDYEWMTNVRKGFLANPKPDDNRAWNVVSFAQWVVENTFSRPPRLARSRSDVPVPDSGEIVAHQDKIARSLVEAYSNPEVHRYASAYSIVRTLQYLASKRKLREIRTVFHLLDNTNFRITASALNTMLQASATAQDLHGFRFVLSVMLARQVRPTWESWASLLELVSKRSLTDAHTIRERMQALNLLHNPAARKRVAASLIKRDFQEWLDSGKDGKQFLAHYDQLLWGPEWLSRESANILVDVRATRGQFAIVNSLLDEFDVRRCKLNVVTLNTILTLASTHGNVAAGVTLASRLLHPGYQIQPNAITYKTLFALAWTRRSPNMVRVIWRYACMAGHVTFDMRRDIEESVLSFALSGSSKAANQADRPSRNQTFRTFAGKLAIGISGGRRRAETTVASEAEHWLLTHGTEKEKDVREAEVRAARTARLKEIVMADIAHFGNLVPLHPLRSMLEKAFEMDRSWKDARLVDDLETMFATAIDVPVVKKIVDDGEERSYFENVLPESSRNV